MGEIFSLVVGLLVLFYIICCILMPIYVFSIKEATQKSHKELQKLNDKIEHLLQEVIKNKNFKGD